MIEFFLERTVSDDNGTFGILTMQGNNKLCMTCELPWKNNQSQISCIPTGTYECIRHNSLKFPNTWELRNVPDRDEILIHTGNTIKDTHGCILVGDKLGTLDDLPAVIDSQNTMKMLRNVLPANFSITITHG